ncbi:hypothetical protein D1610_07655 [Sphingomonas gilva]|uniref:Lipoprotein n=1 Tax=Sphingomonas gilva TaxID=2305907 RepID=A0A396RPL6_9SPHN|nr:hypothetical protein [Sphingomonas gilva]RHW18329.1 hypothetical protein D1610_07655 [Sphingomonas gilva]
MRILVLAPLIALAACVRPSAPPPAPAPVRPAPAPTPAPPPTPAPLSSDWRDWPITPGTWSYRADPRGSVALFGEPGSEARLTLRCDRQAGRVYLSRAGDGPASSMTVRTTSTTRALPVRPVQGATPYIAAELGPRDPLLDAMAFSRGRFIVETAGLPYLAVPAWAEVARVTEDCR